MKVIRLTALVLLLCITTSFLVQAQVGVGTTAPNSSAMLDVTSTSKGFLPPRVTSQQRDSIPTPAIGLMVWCTNCAPSGELDIFNGSNWQTSVGDTAAVGRSLYNLQIGDTLLNGIVAYIYLPGDANYVAGQVHGIIATFKDIGSATWDNNKLKDVKTGAVYTRLGDGGINTKLIIAAQGTYNKSTKSDYAAYIVQQYENGNWYLPDLDEMQKLEQSKTTIGGFSGQTYNTNTKKWGLTGGAQYKTYWTSSVFDRDQDIEGQGAGLENVGYAASLDLFQGALTNTFRTTVLYVRPVKKF